MMLSKRPMRFFTSPLLVPCCAHAKAGGLLRSRTVSGAIQQGCARVFDPKKDGAARLVRSSAREPEGAWTGPPRSILITRAKNLYDQKTPKGHQNFTLGKYKPSRSVLTNRDCSATLGAANDGSARPLCLRAPAGQPFAYSRVGKGRTLSAVPSNSNFPASHLGSQPSLIAQSYRAFFISATLSLNHMPDKPTQKTRTTRKSRPRRLEGPRRGISEPKVASDI